MKTKVPIKNANGKLCGWIIIDENGDKKATDANGKYLGWYRVSTNTTCDYYGKIVARADVLSSLIPLN